MLKSEQYYNPIWIGGVYIFLAYIICTYWYKFKQIPVHFYSWTGVAWGLCVYRLLNQDKNSVLNQFLFGSWIRIGWTIIFNLFIIKTLFPNRMALVNITLEILVASIIFIKMPLTFLRKLWQNRLFRFLIFFFDQMSRGWGFTALFNIIVLEIQNPLLAIIICIPYGMIRPGMQILTGYLNGNLNKENKKKWLTIWYLNSLRAIIQMIINIIISQKPLNQNGYFVGTLGQTLLLFNVIYCGTVGYLMYNQSYYL